VKHPAAKARAKSWTGVRAWSAVVLASFLVAPSASAVYNLGAFWVKRALSAPTDLLYAETPALFVRDVAATTDLATLTGGPATFGISPALPAGLSLNTSTGAISGTPTVTAAPTDYTITASNALGSTSKSLTLTVKVGRTVAAAANGAYPSPLGGWSTSDSAPADGYALDAFNYPSDVAIDAAGGVFYVADKNNNRIVKHSIATGAAISWIGKVSTAPTGGAAGCTTTFPGNMTPGWCVGGTARVGNSSMPHANGVSFLHLDSANGLLYANLTDGAIAKYSVSTGALLGWIGRVGNQPTGGAAGCTTTTSGNQTPGWCTGGWPSSGYSLDGGIRVTGGMAIDSTNTYAYLSDTQMHRIQKFNLSTGTFVGWIGKISTSPTGGDAGCNGATGVTPGWCTGGSSTTGTALGEFSYPGGVVLDGAGYLYVAESNNHRLVKINLATGQAVGWQGMIQTSPTGGDAGCNGAAANTFTPGWCTGGSPLSQHFTINMALSNANALAIDTAGSVIYVGLSARGTLIKVGLNGGFQGWYGKISTSPTGGAAGCNGAAVGTITPGWCTGGYSTVGNSNGMISYYAAQPPVSLKIDATNSKLYIIDMSGHRVIRTGLDATSPQWIGATMAVGAWTTAMSNTKGSILGTFNTPMGIAVDSVNGYFYTTEMDYYTPRVQKFNLSTGAFVGWIGRIGTSPTGGAAGCNGAAVGTVTPGWCTGGLQAPNNTAGDGSLNYPRAAVVDPVSDYLYVTSEYAVLRYKASDGSFQGWFGRIGTSPTGGDAGCAGASVGAMTPGWCRGGASANGTGDGGFNQARGIALDATNGFLYVADQTFHRISKLTTAGAFVGWIGKISASPTGGAAGCNGAASSTGTVGWCTGGTSASGSGDNMFNNPSNLSVDPGRDTLYVADTYNHRIMKITASTGAFIGWWGKVSTSPTGGTTGCAGAAANTLAPGWCVGGTATSHYYEGGVVFPSGVWTDPASGAVYILDNQSRITVLSPGTGKSVGWYGTVSSGNNPTGGVPGCTTTSLGPTPGLCRGGTSGASVYTTPIVGHIDANGSQLYFDATSGILYVVDTANHRIQRLTNM
jgi:DNA-binding beta-propeller fold protein YncE